MIETCQIWWEYWQCRTPPWTARSLVTLIMQKPLSKKQVKQHLVPLFHYAHEKSFSSGKLSSCRQVSWYSYVTLRVPWQGYAFLLLPRYTVGQIHFSPPEKSFCISKTEMPIVFTLYYCSNYKTLDAAILVFSGYPGTFSCCWTCPGSCMRQN